MAVQSTHEMCLRRYHDFAKPKCDWDSFRCFSKEKTNFRTCFGCIFSVGVANLCNEAALEHHLVEMRTTMQLQL